MKLLAVLVGFAPTLLAQSLDEVRTQLRERVRAVRYGSFLASVAGLSEESALSGGAFHEDGGSGSSPGTAFEVLALPLATTFGLGDDPEGLRVRAEVVLGYATARLDFGDVWTGGAPGSETRAISTYETYGGVGGVGLDVPLAGLRVTPMFELGLSHVRNDTSYSGPGATVTGALLDGILFNLDATYLVYGGALLVEVPELRWGCVRCTPLVRYDYRRFDEVSGGAGLGGAGDQQWAAAWLRLEGPTGWSLLERDVWWTGLCGYKRFLGQGGGPLGFLGYAELGAGLEWDCVDQLPLLSRLGLQATMLVGDDVFGWTVGGAFAF
ncbi:MAG: hypothetical protein R3F29_08355 [Planctomycetota bacterium]